ncbi:MAG TPA: hypothetical protein VKD22_08755, partial [Ramlibacter sp.]|nr:hypothetical protein [Ramlibacter sp.]
QIVAKVGAGSAVALAINNRSGMSEGRVADLKQKIASALRAQGLEAVEASRAVAQLEVTVSENAQGYLLVAVINEGQSHDVTMVSMAGAASATTRGGSLLVLRKTPVLTQDAPILDAALLANGTELLVLDVANVSLYSLANGAGTLLAQQSVPFTIRSRDLRGRLVLRRDHLFDAYLPGVICSSADASMQAMQCRASDDPWPLDAGEGSLNAFYASTRNYFTGTLSGTLGRGQDAGAFYSAAVLGDGDARHVLFRGVDGAVRMLSGGKMAALAAPAWGSDIAALNSGCASGWQVLATAPGDYTSGDSVQAYEINGRDAAPVSQRIEFSGPVTALWTSADRAGVMAVSHNLTTGQYEAAILTMACSR